MRDSIVASTHYEGGGRAGTDLRAKIGVKANLLFSPFKRIMRIGPLNCSHFRNSGQFCSIAL